MISGIPGNPGNSDMTRNIQPKKKPTTTVTQIATARPNRLTQVASANPRLAIAMP